MAAARPARPQRWRRHWSCAGALWVAALCAGPVRPVQGLLQKRFGRIDVEIDANPNPYTQVGAQVGAQVVSHAVASGSSAVKYLIVSFPLLHQVAYCKLPDNVWRPLVLGNVSEPSAIAVDTQSGRFFVADPPNEVIWQYKLAQNSGFLETTGQRMAAVENVTASWIAVNSVGDLYFTGSRGASNANHTSLWRQDARNLITGNSRAAVELYTRDNTGMPEARAWVPSGVAVDALFVYWGNGQGGKAHGSVVKGSRQNIELLPTEQGVEVLSQAVNKVQGMTSTGTHLFYATTQGLYGVLKSEATPITNPTLGLVAGPPGVAAGRDGNSAPWNPLDVTWDGDSTLYFTESSMGAVFSVPSLNMQQHALTKHADAPGVYGVTVVSFQSGAVGLAGVLLLPCLCALASVLL